jgi:hypothetical protein
LIASQVGFQTDKRFDTLAGEAGAAQWARLFGAAAAG